MTLAQFIRENRAAISEAVARAYGDNCKPTNDADRADWIRNDEGLYNWAKMEGVKHL